MHYEYKQSSIYLFMLASFYPICFSLRNGKHFFLEFIDVGTKWLAHLHSTVSMQP